MIKLIKKEILKKFRLSFAIVAMIVPFFVENISGLDQRSHLFAGNGAITDEGFRWRNSFNFRINGQPILYWEFNRGGNWIGNAFNAINNFVMLDQLNPGQQGNLIWTADRIHQRLSHIANGGLAATNQQNSHMSAAAVTIVVQNPNINNQLEAYTEVIKDTSWDQGGNALIQNVAAVSVPANYGQAIIPGVSMYYSPLMKVPNGQNSQMTQQIYKGVYANLNDKLDCALSNTGANNYSCGEGQIISRLFDDNPPDVPNILQANAGAQLNALFAQTIHNLIVAANAHIGGGITQGNIVLVVLHIHTRQDPCAKCTQTIAGLSRQMNLPPHAVGNHGTQTNLMTNFLNADFTRVFGNANNPLLTKLGNGQARFLIEVSSNAEYHYTGNNCSNAENAGRDANAANQLNITTGVPINFDIDLAVPRFVPPPVSRAERNWHFPATFPPYVRYGRISPINGATQPIATCAGGANHATVVQLPPVQ